MISSAILISRTLTSVIELNHYFCINMFETFGDYSEGNQYQLLLISPYNLIVIVVHVHLSQVAEFRKYWPVPSKRQTHFLPLHKIRTQDLVPAKAKTYSLYHTKWNFFFCSHLKTYGYSIENITSRLLFPFITMCFQEQISTSSEVVIYFFKFN